MVGSFFYDDDADSPASSRRSRVEWKLRKQFDYEEARIQTFPMKFACPSVTLRDGATNFGATEAAHAWGDAVAEG